MAKRREGEVMFTGAAHTWGKPAGGSTGVDHPFRRKSAKAIAKYEQRKREELGVTIALLEQMGVPVRLEPREHERALGELDRFVEEHKLEQRGIDVVFEQFERARYDHDEF